MLVNVSPGFLSVTLYEFLVLISVRNRLLTENYRGRVTDGLTITHTDRHLTLYSRINEFAMKFVMF